MADTSTPSPQLFIKPEHSYQLTGFLGWLVKLYRLDVYDDSLLTRRAGYEMQASAIMLTIIALFDFMAWSLFWTIVFYFGELTIGWRTPLALFCAALLAGIVFIYERQFITADPDEAKIGRAMLIRIAIIAATALITTQPVEVAVFYGATQRRAHEESVRAEALARLRQLERAERETKGAQAFQGTIPDKIHKEQLDIVQKAQEVLALAQAAVNQATQNRDAAETRRNEASRRFENAGPQQKEVARQTLARAESRLSQAEAVLNNATQQLSETDARLGIAQREERIARQPLVADEYRARVLRERITNWIAQVRGSNSDTAITEDRAPLPPLPPPPSPTPGPSPEAGATPGSQPSATPQIAVNMPYPGGDELWKFQAQNYDFSRRLIVISDLSIGRPPRWPESIAPRDIGELEARFGIGDPESDPVDDFLPLVIPTPTPEALPVAEVSASPSATPAATPTPVAQAAALSPEEIQRLQAERTRDLTKARKRFDQAKTRRETDAAVFKFSYWVVVFVAGLIPFLIIAGKLLFARELTSYYSYAAQQRRGRGELFGAGFAYGEPQVNHTEQTSPAAGTSKKKSAAPYPDANRAPKAGWWDKAVKTFKNWRDWVDGPELSPRSGQQPPPPEQPKDPPPPQ